MAITSITIENFKGIGDAVTIPIRPITLLFGKNSSGKSTVLQALHYIREVCEHAGADSDRTHMGGDYIDLGGFRSLVHLHELDRKIRIRIEFDLTSEESKSLNRLLKHLTNPDSAWIEVVTSWKAAEHSVYTESYGYGFNGAEWIHLTLTERPGAKPSDMVSSNGAKWYPLNNAVFLNIKHPDIKHPIEDDYSKKIQSEILPMLPGIVLKELRDIRYLGPMRKIPPRDYRPQQTPDESLWAEGLEAWNTLGRDPQLVKKINRYMQDVLKLGYSISRQEIISLDRDGEIIKNLKKICNSEDFKVDELKKCVRDPLEQSDSQIRMKLHDEENNIDLDSADVGLGIPQVIPVLVGALHSGRSDPKRFYLSKPPGGFFAVEQPELHLHPAAQVALGDVFIACIKYNSVRENLKEYFESIKEKYDHPDIQNDVDRCIDNLNNGDRPSTVLRMFVENLRATYPDIQNDFQEMQAAFKRFTDSMNDSMNRTMLVETHSEHLLLRLLRRVRETTRRSRHQTTELEQTAHELTPNDLSVVYVRPTPAGVKFTPLTVTDNGDFDAPWPEGFFDERDSELF